MKRGPKASNKSSWEKRSLELEAEVGDDSEAYNIDDEELEELLEDDLLAESLAEAFEGDPDDEDFDDEDEDPPLVWDDEMEDYV